MKLFRTVQAFAYKCFSKHPAATIFLGTFTATYVPMHQFLVKPLKKDVEKLQLKLDELDKQLVYKEDFLNKLLQDNNFPTNSLNLIGETPQHDTSTETVE